MLLIEDKLISDDLMEIEFVCNLNACKGACCVEGDFGAPLEPEELPILEEIYPKVAPYLPQAGRKAIEKQGPHVVEKDGTLATPMVNGKECAYTVFEKGFAWCGIEKAWRDGKIDFMKPISCHLYPIRVTKMEEFDALNYDEWSICSAACDNGKKLKVPVYQFLKAPLVRAYGEEFYQQLDEIAQDFAKAREQARKK